MEEKNSLEALQNAVELGFGIETDIRDFDGELVISHGPPEGKVIMLTKFFENIKNHANFRKVTYALNIKSDGLDEKLEKIISDYGLMNNVFFFDMSFPTLLWFSKKFGPKNLSTRISEFEQSPILLYEKCGWICVDCFNTEWITDEMIGKFLKEEKKLFFISPEIHKREPLGFWKFLKGASEKYGEEFYLCTDLVEKAEKFF